MGNISLEQNIMLASDALERMTATNATDVDLDYVRFLIEEIKAQADVEPMESYEDGDNARDELRVALGLRPMGVMDKSALVMHKSASRVIEKLMKIRERRGITVEEVAEALEVEAVEVKELEEGGELSMGDCIMYGLAVGGHIDITVTDIEEFNKRYPYLENNFSEYRDGIGK